MSMGGFSARKALQVVRNVETVVAIELLAACQALEFFRPLKTTPALERVHTLVRERVAPWDGDRCATHQRLSSSVFVFGIFPLCAPSPAHVLDLNPCSHHYLDCRMFFFDFHCARLPPPLQLLLPQLLSFLTKWHQHHQPGACQCCHFCNYCFYCP